MNFLKKKINGLLLRKRFARFGIFYTKSSSMKIPGKLTVNGISRQINFPDKDKPVFYYEFIEICIRDGYHLNLLKKNLKSVHTIVDIGANQGLFALAARQEFAHAKIFCYEPNKLLEPVLSYNALQLNSTVYYEAVARENGFVELEFGETDLNTVAKISEAGSIKAVAFKEVVKRAGGKIDILKLDCEGGEWDLFGDKETWKQVRSVTMEYHLWANKGSSASDIKKILEDLNFFILKQDELSADFGLITAINNIQ